MINFIGIGAQKSGTSWVYACLYEHPEICAPVKEIHFFSRPRFQQGKEWYEAHFKNCNEDLKKGEFSTSYLFSEDAPSRINELYPDVKLIAILRNPVERAYSHYRNAIKSGEINETLTFDEFVEQVPSALSQGLYAEQLERYYKLFPKEQILVLIYEDSKKDPASFIKRIYQFLGIDNSFVPSMLNAEINIARTPKVVWVERVMHHVAEFLRKTGFDKLVWHIKKLGIPEMVRGVNTKTVQRESAVDFGKYKDCLKEDTYKLSQMLDRDLNSEWGI